MGTKMNEYMYLFRSKFKKPKINKAKIKAKVKGKLTQWKHKLKHKRIKNSELNTSFVNTDTNNNNNNNNSNNNDIETKEEIPFNNNDYHTEFKFDENSPYLNIFDVDPLNLNALQDMFEPIKSKPSIKRNNTGDASNSISLDTDIGLDEYGLFVCSKNSIFIYKIEYQLKNNKPFKFKTKQLLKIINVFKDIKTMYKSLNMTYHIDRIQFFKYIPEINLIILGSKAFPCIAIYSIYC